MRVSILIMAFLPPLRALTSASSARDPVSLHWASSSFLSFSRAMASSCSHLSSSARRAASTMALAAFSSERRASLVISSRSPCSWLYSDSSFLRAAAMDWLTLLSSARFSLGSASSCSAARLCLSAVSRRARLSSRVFCMAAAFVSRDLGISSSRLGLGLGINLALGIAHLQLVRLDGGLGLSVASDGVLKSKSEVSSISLQLLLHSQSLGLALGLSFKSRLHGVKSLGLILADHGKLLILLSNAALNLSLDLRQLHLASQHLVLLLLQSGLGLLQGRLELHLLSLEPLADFVNLVDGAASLSDLVHDVLDLIGEGLVLTSDLLQLEDSLLVGRLDLEELRGGIAGLLLGNIKVE